MKKLKLGLCFFALLAVVLGPTYPLNLTHFCQPNMKNEHAQKTFFFRATTTFLQQRKKCASLAQF